MRTRAAAAVLFLASLLPKTGNAQVYQFTTPPPSVTAASAPWQVAGAPILFNGIVYFPTALVRPFDGNVMAQVGTFDGVPVYADATLEPFSIVYVPVARGMRTYERERSGEFAGTTGSQTPSLPVQPVTSIRSEASPVATTGLAVGAPAATTTAGAIADRAPDIPARPARTRIESVPEPRETDGVWIRYEGSKWYSAGSAAPYSPDRFARIGDYRGFPVYRERGARDGRIWVAVVEDGPVAPYAQR